MYVNSEESIIIEWIKLIPQLWQKNTSLKKTEITDEFKDSKGRWWWVFWLFAVFTSFDSIEKFDKAHKLIYKSWPRYKIHVSMESGRWKTWMVRILHIDYVWNVIITYGTPYMKEIMCYTENGKM